MPAFTLTAERLIGHDEASSDRYRRAFWTATTGLMARGVQFAAGLITIPVTLNYLGHEHYGVWMTITSTAVLLSFADFGLANGLVNIVADALGKSDRRRARRAVATALYLLAAIAAGAVLLVAALASHVPWHLTFNVPPSAEINRATLIALDATLIALPLSVAAKLQLARQEGFVANIWTAVGACAGAAGVLTAVRLNLGLAALVCAASLGPLAAAMANSATLFASRTGSLLPRPCDVSAQVARELARIGLAFFVLQLLSVALFSSDNIIIAHALGPAAVTEYAVPQRLFSIVPVLLSVALTPLWPAYADAFARGDLLWMRRAYQRSLGAVLFGVSAAAVVLVLTCGRLVAIWTSGAVRPDWLPLAALGIQTTVTATAVPLSLVLNATGTFRAQILCAVLVCGAATPLKWYLLGHVGIAGVPLATAASQLLLWVVPLGVVIERSFRLQWRTH